MGQHKQVEFFAFLCGALVCTLLGIMFLILHNESGTYRAATVSFLFTFMVHHWYMDELKKLVKYIRIKKRGKL
jgi:hypothetical protein